MIGYASYSEIFLIASSIAFIMALLTICVDDVKPTLTLLLCNFIRLEIGVSFLMTILLIIYRLTFFAWTGNWS